MRKFSLKILFIILGSIIVVGGVVTCLYFVLDKDNKTTDDDSLVTTELQKVDINNNSGGLETVKSNIVRIINNLGDDKIVGSGFFIEDGYLVTNSHVVDIKGDITVQYSDGKTSKATLVSNDITSDVALLSVDDIHALAMNFGNTLNVKVTDDLYAVGYALNLEGEASITKGILSARRSIAGIEYLQTDAAINSGFSGGPLLNAKGEVVGINSLANDNATIGMAISSESLQNIIAKLISDINVSYLDSDRPANALSSVLKEVGYEIDDLYDEWKHFHKGEEKPAKKEETETKPYVASNNCELSYLGVEGYDIGWEKRDESRKFHLNLVNHEDNINVIVKTKDSKATYTVRGNKNLAYGYTTIYVTVTAENKINKQEYYIITQKLNTRLEGLFMVDFDVSISENRVTGAQNIKFMWHYFDSNGQSVLTEGNTNAIEKVDIDAYVCSGETQCDGNSENLKFLKKYTFIPVNFDINANISGNDIKTYLTDEDYNVFDQAGLYFKASVFTKHQGTFSADGISYINK